VFSPFSGRLGRPYETRAVFIRTQQTVFGPSTKLSPGQNNVAAVAVFLAKPLYRTLVKAELAFDHRNGVLDLWPGVAFGALDSRKLSQFSLVLLKFFELPGTHGIDQDH